MSSIAFANSLIHSELSSDLSLDDILTSKYFIDTHKKLFESDRYYQPGMLRINEEHARSRQLLSENKFYYVMYHKGIVTEDKIQSVLDDFKEQLDNRNINIEKRLSQLYASLDHLHPFEDGNSRTIRKFMMEVADKLGFDLNWEHTNREDNSVDELYKARDLEVISKSFPNLTKDSLKHAGKDEFEAYDSLSFLKKNTTSLEDIFKRCLTPNSKILAAKIDDKDSNDIILNASLSRNLDETQKAVHDALDIERQQNFLIENQYTDSLNSIINEKNEQVKRLETKLSKLISETNNQINRLQSSKPGIFALPSKKKNWDSAINKQKHIVTVASQRLEHVHEIREDMGLQSSKIEDMAKKKLYYRDPQLVKKYRGVVQNENEKRIAEHKKREELKKQQEVSNKVAQSFSRGLSISKN